MNKSFARQGGSRAGAIVSEDKYGEAGTDEEGLMMRPTPFHFQLSLDAQVECHFEGAVNINWFDT